MLTTVDKFDYEVIHNAPAEKRHRGNQGTKSRKVYKNLVCAFDIETSPVPFTDYSIMYIWQFQIGDTTVIGRTWQEFLQFLNRLESELGEAWLCIYVHNLSFEFQFLTGIYRFAPEEVFAIRSRKVLKCEMMEHFEFRCSYLLTNSSLANFTRKMGIEHEKKSSVEYNHRKYRTPQTPLTPAELEYCTNDVVGLVEALKVKMKRDGDNLYSIPMTSTGYVRRDTKVALRYVNRGYISNQIANYHVYTLLREAFRGGNTHANRYFAGEILHNVKSYDRSSSYPDVQCNDLFPVTGFEEGRKDVNWIMRELKKGKNALLLTVGLYNVRQTNVYNGFPYLAKDKCRGITAGSYDNGRILTADYLETTVTDIDLRILLKTYTFDDIVVGECFKARYGKLPPTYIHNVEYYYRRKTELKGVEGESYNYARSKEMLNSIYGMTAQDPVKQSIDYLSDVMDGCPFVMQGKSKEEIYNAYLRKAWLPYQWGVWTTARARERLEDGINWVYDHGGEPVYVDTDSVKYLGEIDWSEYNALRQAASEKSKAYATDPQGVTHYMGVYEPDGEYPEFKTLGAKKYAYRADDKTHTTIAGVNKRLGGAELDNVSRETGKHPLELFADGFVFKEAGGTESSYFDNIPPEDKTLYTNGVKMEITNCITIKDSEYTLGSTQEYMTLLALCGKGSFREVWL